MWHFLTEREAEYCDQLLDEFERENYLRALAASVRKAGLSTQSMSLLFELRYAKSLKQRGLIPHYEYPTLSNTSVDFAYSPEPQTMVLAELVSINLSEAIRRGTRQEVDEDGIQWSGFILRMDNENPRLSEEGEVFLVQQKICEKVFRNGQAIKFPVPDSPGRFNVLVVDMRGFLGGGGGDNADCKQLCYGNDLVNEFERRYWTNPATGIRGPIRGLFEDTDRPRGAPTLRERVHGIFFTRDTRYVDGSLTRVGLLAYNPRLITSEAEHQRLKAAVLG